LVVLSEQQLVDCSKGSNHGCKGGFGNLGLDYIAKRGQMLESDYPYTGRDEKCKYDEKKVVARIGAYATVPQMDPIQKLAASAANVICTGLQAD